MILDQLFTIHNGLIVQICCLYVHGLHKLLVIDSLPLSCTLFLVMQNAEGVIATALMYADAVWDRDALDSDELSFRVGDVIEVLDMTDDVWWHGSVGETSGWFPASFVRVR